MKKPKKPKTPKKRNPIARVSSKMGTRIKPAKNIKTPPKLGDIPSTGNMTYNDQGGYFG